MVLAGILAVLMILSLLAPLVFAQTVRRFPTLPDVPPLTLRIVLCAVIGFAVLLIAARVVLAVLNKKK